MCGTPLVVPGKATHAYAVLRTRMISGTFRLLIWMLNGLRHRSDVIYLTGGSSVT
jgi:hypothetical protein